MADTRRLGASERAFGIGRKGEKARDRADARRQIEGLNQQDQVIRLLHMLLTEQQRTNDLLDWFAQRTYQQSGGDSPLD